jgi:catechol 2,3-dioxygenase-like lactoylglutathione lyase family enzyme
MARSRFLDHIDLRVKNLEAADAFYRKILPALGFPKRNIEKTGVSFDSAREHIKPEFISLIEDPDHVPNKTRIAFWCDSQAGVDDFVRTLKDTPAKNVEGPMFCPEYSPIYYAVFFEDPCGNRLEVCCRIAETAKGRTKSS